MNKAELEKKVKELEVYIKELQVESLHNHVRYESCEDDFIEVSQANTKAVEAINSFLFVDGYEGGETNKAYQRMLIRILTILEGEE
jgi:hypothetical protein